eukprot:scaffold14_cov15-Tisochrysis_lutea.AAC.1
MRLATSWAQRLLQLLWTGKLRAAVCAQAAAQLLWAFKKFAQAAHEDMMGQFYLFIKVKNASP